MRYSILTLTVAGACFLHAQPKGAPLDLVGDLKQKGSDRRWGLANGIFTILLGLLIVRLLAGKLGIAAISVILGLRLLVEGWRMFLLPEKGFLPPDFKLDTRQHPDRRLRLEPSDAVKEMHDGLLQSAPLLVHRIEELGETLGLVGIVGR